MKTITLGNESAINAATIKPIDMSVLKCAWSSIPFAGMVTKCSAPDFEDDANYQVIGCRNCGAKK